MTIGPLPVYRGCTRFHAADEAALTCHAFPDGIRDAIRLSPADHRVPYPGDHGLRFAPVNEEAARYAAERFERSRDGY